MLGRFLQMRVQRAHQLGQRFRVVGFRFSYGKVSRAHGAATMRERTRLVERRGQPAALAESILERKPRYPLDHDRLGGTPKAIERDRHLKTERDRTENRIPLFLIPPAC